MDTHSLSVTILFQASWTAWWSSGWRGRTCIMPRRRKSCIFKQSSVTVFCRQAGLHGEVLVGRGVSSQEAEYPRYYLLPSLSSRLLQCFAGELNRMVKFWLAGACHAKKEKKDKSSHNIGILNFTSAFILLAAGVLLGTTLLLLKSTVTSSSAASASRSTTRPAAAPSLVWYVLPAIPYPAVNTLSAKQIVVCYISRLLQISKCFNVAQSLTGNATHKTQQIPKHLIQPCNTHTHACASAKLQKHIHLPDVKFYEKGTRQT